MSIDLYFIHDVLIDYGIFLMTALGCYFTMMSGQVSLGHGALAGLGAYATAILTVKMGLPVWLAIPVSGVAGALGGWFVAYAIALRLKGIYLAIGTFAFAEALVVIWTNLDYIGGAVGFMRIPSASSFALVWIVVGLTSFFLWRFELSYLGRAFRAVFDDEHTAAAMGVDVKKVKVMAWVIGGTITAIGGALFAHSITIARPNNFEFHRSVLILLAPSIGGCFTFWGSYIGAAVIVIGPWLLNWILSIGDFAGVPDISDPVNKSILYALLYIFITIWRPDGVISRHGIGRPTLLRMLAKRHDPAARRNRGTGSARGP